MTVNGSANDGEAAENDNVKPDVENVTGGSGADTITGSSANNLLNGGGGHDSLSGLAGNDTLNGGEGNDTFAEGAAASGDTVSPESLRTPRPGEDDTLDGGTGSDLAGLIGRPAGSSDMASPATAPCPCGAPS